VGASLSYNIISYETLDGGYNNQNPLIESNNITKLGFGVLGGYLYQFKKLSAFIEADFIFSPGGFNNLMLLAGLNIHL
jgi:hypothetical protein